MHRIPFLLVIQLRALSVFAIVVISQRCRLQLKRIELSVGKSYHVASRSMAYLTVLLIKK